MTDTIAYRTHLDNVDWEQLKETLGRDQFDNGRSADQLRSSFENSRHVVLADAGHTIIGTARALSDDVCNAYIVDVWTRSDYRRQGIASHMMHLLLEQLSGQHVSLFTDKCHEFYEHFGFHEQPTGFSRVMGTWLAGTND